MANLATTFYRISDKAVGQSLMRMVQKGVTQAVDILSELNYEVTPLMSLRCEVVQATYNGRHYEIVTSSAWTECTDFRHALEDIFGVPIQFISSEEGNMYYATNIEEYRDAYQVQCGCVDKVVFDEMVKDETELLKTLSYLCGKEVVSLETADKAISDYNSNANDDYLYYTKYTYTD